jgi:hypothetical protein
MNNPVQGLLPHGLPVHYVAKGGPLYGNANTHLMLPAISMT